MKTILFTAVLFLSACAGHGGAGVPDVTLPSIKIDDKQLGLNGEGFPFVMPDGKLRYASAPRTGNQGEGILIYENGFKRNAGPTGMAFISGIVESGTLYVFGVTRAPEAYSPSSKNEIVMTSTSDLAVWTNPVTILTSEVGEPFFNTSITKDTQGFLMATEVCGVHGCFNFKFARSTQIASGWQVVPDSYFGEGSYAACPMVRFVDGFYYVFYLEALNLNTLSLKTVTSVIRSKDLHNWEHGKYRVFYPSPQDTFLGRSATNMSDVDLIEYQGHVELVVYDGDQLTWGNSLRAVYDGSLSQLMKEFF